MPPPTSLIKVINSGFFIEHCQRWVEGVSSSFARALLGLLASVQLFQDRVLYGQLGRVNSGAAGEKGCVRSLIENKLQLFQRCRGFRRRTTDCSLCYEKQCRSQPWICLGAICLTLGEQQYFRLGRRFSKHKMTRYAKNFLGGMAPWLRLWRITPGMATTLNGNK